MVEQKLSSNGFYFLSEIGSKESSSELEKEEVLELRAEGSNGTREVQDLQGSVRDGSELSGQELKLCQSMCFYPVMCRYPRAAVEVESEIKPRDMGAVREVRV